MTYTVDVICCVCKRKIGQKPGFPTPNPSHGYCPACIEETLSKLPRKENPNGQDKAQGI